VSEPLLISVREAAARLGIGRDTCYALVAEGRLRSLRLGRRRLVPVVELAAFTEREARGGEPNNGKAAARGNRAAALDEH
jgi:excisionase family DNA binding protein